MSLLAAQCRAARALLDWSQADLAEISKVATKTLADFERGHRVPYVRTLADIRKALENAGVVFVEENGEGPGVRLQKDRSPEKQARIVNTLDAEHAAMDKAPSPRKALNRMKAAIVKDEKIRPKT